MCALKKKKPGLEDDDRNLVLVDGDFSEADLDDRAWLIWERYKRGILIGSAVVFVAGLGAILWNSLRASHAENLAAEYARLTKPTDRMGFAERNRGETIGAFAAVEAADDAYKAGDLKVAGDRYAVAADIAKALRPVPDALLGRAVAGRAVCAFRTGDTAGAKLKLETIANDGAIADGVRAHALYLLAQNACGEKDFATAKKYADRIDKLTGAAGWQASGSPKAELVAAFPELLKVAGVAPAAKP